MIDISGHLAHCLYFSLLFFSLCLPPSPMGSEKYHTTHRLSACIMNYVKPCSKVFIFHISTDSDQHWACEFCTYINRNRTICEICFKSRTTPLPPKKTKPVRNLVRIQPGNLMLFHSYVKFLLNLIF